MLAAAAIGYLCKHHATLSAAEGGCQAEIGVASSMAAALIVLPALALLGYKHWLDTRTFHPLDIPVSLSRAHVRTPEFYINLPGKYLAGFHVDYSAVDLAGGCEEKAWASLQTHLVVFENGFKIGEADGPMYGMIGVFRAARKTHYWLDVEILSDASCLNTAHPRLTVWSASDFPFDHLYQVWLWTLPIGVAAGLGLIFRTFSPGYGSRKAQFHAITVSDGGRVPTGMPVRKRRPARLLSRLPAFSFFTPTLLALLLFVELILNAPFPQRGIYVSIKVRRPNRDAPSSLVPVVVKIEVSPLSKGLTNLYVNSTPVEWDVLKAALMAELKLRPEWVVYIDGDPNLTWQEIVKVADAATELHAKVVFLTPETRQLIEPAATQRRVERR
jgi:biopolymer transport protein ExbD